MFGSEEKGCKLIGRGLKRWKMKDERRKKHKREKRIGNDKKKKRKSDCEFGKKE